MPATRRMPSHSIAQLVHVFFLMAALLPFQSMAAESVQLTVAFKLTDLDYKPIPGANVRLVIASPDQPNAWQKASAGRQFITGPDGTHSFECTATLEPRRYKRPTNFVSSLLRRPEPTEFLKAAVELEYAGHRWLYVVDLYRFHADGDVLLEKLGVYNRDAAGDFTLQAQQSGHDWKMPDLGELLLTGPGHEPWNFQFGPEPDDPSGKRWKLDLAFKRSPAPVRR